jgi:hypothetical protein
METRSDVTYGTWSHPTLPRRVRYALPVFHEIDFLVSEGYRRIPYGGIEHGGLLFGRTSGDDMEIEAFRQIETEHASGPAFLLSEGDLARVKEQIQGAAADPELAAFEPIGLFVSHSRRELQVDEVERRLLASLCPQSADGAVQPVSRKFEQCPRLLVLLKPEKFKPTQFAFVFPGEPELNIFTLPLPPRRTRPKKKESLAARPSPRKATLIEINEPAQALPVPLPEPPAETVAEPSPAPTTKTDWRLLVSAAAASIVLLLGCFLYFDWNFLQPPIELHAAAEPGHVTLSWLPAETAGTNEANLHIWSTSSQRIVALSPAERHAGQVKIAGAGNDITVELVAHHWLHDRRGVIRVLTNK